jgi:hypothetical protein
MTSKNTNHENIGMSQRRISMSDAERGYAKLAVAETSSENLELNDLRNDSRSREPTTDHTNSHTEDLPSRLPTLYEQYLSRRHVFWNRLRGKGRKVPGWAESARNAVCSSCTQSYVCVLSNLTLGKGINLLFLFMPFAWASHFENVNFHWPHELTFACEYSTSFLNAFISDTFGSVLYLHYSPREDVRLGRRTDGSLSRQRPRRLSNHNA